MESKEEQQRMAQEWADRRAQEQRGLMDKIARVDVMIGLSVLRGDRHAVDHLGRVRDKAKAALSVSRRAQP